MAGIAQDARVVEHHARVRLPTIYRRPRLFARFVSAMIASTAPVAMIAVAAITIGATERVVSPVVGTFASFALDAVAFTGWEAEVSAALLVAGLLVCVLCVDGAAPVPWVVALGCACCVVPVPALDDGVLVVLPALVDALSALELAASSVFALVVGFVSPSVD